MESKDEQQKNSLTVIPNPILKNFYGSMENSKKSFLESIPKLTYSSIEIVSSFQKVHESILQRLSWVLKMALPFFRVKFRLIFVLHSP